jgi:hypothetical protein
MKYFNEITTNCPCDVCGKPAKFYDTTWYIHICSEECFDEFMDNYDNIINSIAIKRLEPDE